MLADWVFMVFVLVLLLGLVAGLLLLSSGRADPSP